MKDENFPCMRKLRAIYEECPSALDQKSIQNLVDSLNNAINEQKTELKKLREKTAGWRERLEHVEDYYRNLLRQSEEMMADPTSENPFSKYFEKVDTMMLKHLPKIYRFYKDLQIKQFGLPPPCYNAFAARSFSTWRKIESGGYY